MPKFLLILSLFIIFNFLSVFCELCGELLRKNYLIYGRTLPIKDMACNESQRIRFFTVSNLYP